MANLNPLCDVCGEARASISDGVIGALICQNPACFEKAWDRAFSDRRCDWCHRLLTEKAPESCVNPEHHSHPSGVNAGQVDPPSGTDVVPDEAKVVPNTCPAGHFIWSAQHWSPMLSIAEHLGDRESVKVLIEHGLYVDHCGGYEVAAWPCPIAVDTLTFLVEETP